jgi:cation diffusion facilitator CzcD-associated flavoprotein CzcO
MAQEHFDVLIIGAGLSGIGAAHELQDKCPQKSFAILEMRDSIGGTWDIHRYPGIRSDSDMFTFGYKWRPWASDQTLADGPAILQYIKDTAREAGIDKKIRFNQKVLKGEWSTSDAQWTITAQDTQSGQANEFTADFVYVCSGYYKYDEGHIPDFKGMDQYTGQILHPMSWPEDLDYTGKRVVVIGSGATAVTLVPAMTDKAAHVTMLQRSPTYMASVPSRDPIARITRRIMPEKWAYVVNRWKNVMQQVVVYRLSQSQPRFMKGFLLGWAKRQLPDDYDFDKHFKPRYNPWDQRLCAVPDGDIFEVISEGKASVVTDTIDSFTEHGIRLDSGQELAADIVVTATGFNLQMMGGAEMLVDGEPVSLPDHMAYKGMMLSDIPNHVFTVGYTNSSWTLKADLVSDYACRLLNYMDDHGYDVCIPHNDDPSVVASPLLDFGAGYVQRAIDGLPKQGSKPPWRLGMNYPHDWYTLPRTPIDDGVLKFSRRAATPAVDAAEPVPEPV